MQLVPSNDTEIISMLQSRDAKAMSLILEKYGDKLYGFIFQQFDSEQLAHEALKKTLSVVWTESLEYNKKPEYFFIWILRQATKISKEMKYSQISSS